MHLDDGYPVQAETNKRKTYYNFITADNYRHANVMVDLSKLNMNGRRSLKKKVRFQDCFRNSLENLQGANREMLRMLPRDDSEEKKI